MKTIEALKSFYDGLDRRFEGYIQMSNKKLEIFAEKPSWDQIHETNNFIFEACLFDGDRSIMIRQVNDRFLVIDRKISDFHNKSEEMFFAKEGKKVKMIQVWEAKKDKNCLDMEVLQPTLQLFAGFEGDLS